MNAIRELLTRIDNRDRSWGDNVVVAIPDDLLRRLRTLEKLQTVNVTVEGCVIQDVDCPEGVEVVVCDYDTDNITETDLAKGQEFAMDADGNDYIRTVWSKQ